MLAYLAKVAIAGRAARGVRDHHRQDARVSCAGVPRHFVDARAARRSADVRDAEPVTDTLSYDVAHLLAGGMVLVSFMLLYQDRMSALLNVFALHAAVLSLVGRVAGLRAGRAASLRHRIHRARPEGDPDSVGTASHRAPARHPSRSRNRGGYRHDDAGRRRSRSVVDRADAEGDRRASIRSAARISRSRLR